MTDCCNGKEYPPHPNGTLYVKCSTCGRDLSAQQRSKAQNRSIHKWAEELSTELNDRGLDMKAVLKPDVDIPWDKTTIKRFIIHPIIKAMYDKESTADLTTGELSKAVDVINRHLVDKWEFTLPFPSEESRML